MGKNMTLDLLRKTIYNQKMDENDFLGRWINLFMTRDFAVHS